MLQITIFPRCVVGSQTAGDGLWLLCLLFTIVEVFYRSL
jgi:hypothetical protein